MLVILGQLWQGGVKLHFNKLLPPLLRVKKMTTMTIPFQTTMILIDKNKTKNKIKMVKILYYPSTRPLQTVAPTPKTNLYPTHRLHKTLIIPSNAKNHFFLIKEHQLDDKPKRIPGKSYSPLSTTT